MARAAKVLLLAATVETTITLLHFAHGAHLYDDPGRLHVVAPGLLALAVMAVATGLFLWRPRRLTLAPLLVVATTWFLGVFGLVHGGFFHVIKLAVFLAGGSREMLERIFMSPDYAYPDDLVFEVTGALGFAAAVLVAWVMVRLLRAAHGASPGVTSQGATGAHGARP